MKHHIIAKYIPEITAEQKKEFAPAILELFKNTASIDGIHGVEVHTNCVDRDNRFDIMIVIDMEKDALPEYDSCVWHKEWKNKYGPLLEKKAIFDCE